MSNRWISLALFIASVPLIVVAQQGDGPAAEQPSEHEQHAQATPDTAAPARGAADMHAHMQAMREQMARIHAAQDPEERQRLMDEHMQSMQQHMQMMGRMSQEPDARGAARCAEGDMACRMGEMQAQNGMMQQRMRGMQDRMDSMQQLMEQMLEHLREQQPSRRERDRRR